MNSPLIQAQEIEKGCSNQKMEVWNNDKHCIDIVHCGEKYKAFEIEWCKECKASAKTLLETCEWIINEYDNVNIGIDKTQRFEIKKAIEICRRILK